MSSPVLPNNFRDLIPQSGQSLCAKLVPSITGFMQRYYDHYAFMYDENGDISLAYAQMICALNCFSGTGGGTCPDVVLTASIAVHTTELVLTIDGTSMTDGYEYHIYRKAAIGDAWVEITTGTPTTTGSRIVYTDSGLVNDTQYYYQVTVQKPSCSLYTLGLDNALYATPKLCATLNLMVAVTIEGTSSLSLKVTEPNGRMTSTLPIKIWRSLDSALLGSPIFDGTLADHACTDDQGQAAFCFEDTSLDFLNYYYTVKIQQDVTCYEYVLHANGRPAPANLAAPTLVRIVEGVNTHLKWSASAGAERYFLYRSDLAGGNVRLMAQIVPTNPAAPQDYYINYINKNQWPCNDGGTPGGGGSGHAGESCFGNYIVWVVAVGTSGNQSPVSNSVPVLVVF